MPYFHDRRPSRLSEVVANRRTSLEPPLGGPALFGGDRRSSYNDLLSSAQSSSKLPRRLRLLLLFAAVFFVVVLVRPITPFRQISYSASAVPSPNSAEFDTFFPSRPEDTRYEGGAAFVQKIKQNTRLRWFGSSTQNPPSAKLREDYSEKDGLLYFAGAAPPQAEGIQRIYATLPDQKHPILHLIEEGERKWAALLAGQSKTFGQACEEYKRRHSRSPPAGFELWWRFAVDNKIQLLDEYAAIDRDILPFFSLPPAIFRARVRQLAEDSSLTSFTLNIKNGVASLTGPGMDQPRASETLDLVQDFAKYLPDLQATFSLHDGPGVLLNGDAKARHIQYAKAGKFLEIKQYDDYMNSPDYPGFSGACPPGSPWRRSLLGYDLERPSTLSFIQEHEAAANPCLHPDNAFGHGFLLWKLGPGYEPLYPMFGWAKTALHSDIQVTPLEQYHWEVGNDPAWEMKEQNKLLWRGSNTGLVFDRGTMWRASQRVRFVTLANQKAGSRAVHFADDEGVLRAKVEQVADLNQRYMDVKFSGYPQQCHVDDGTCGALERLFEFVPAMKMEEANSYKYVFDVDGNGWSGRFHRLLSSKAAILKSTVMPEWYQQRIMPWVHYIPVKMDYTDVYDIMSFFVGGANGENNHDELGKRIGMQGKEWSENHWREVDMQAYLFRLLLEYGRLLARSEDNLTAGDLQM